MERKVFVILGTFALVVGLIACGSSSDSATAAASALVVDEGSSEAEPEEATVDRSSEESTTEIPTENTDEDDNITIFEESPKKLLREEIMYGSNEYILNDYRYEYDEAGRLLKRTEYSDSGDVKSWNEYEYDSNGHRIYSAEGCKNDGSIDTWCKYEYNENGKRIHETMGGSDGVNNFCNYMCDYEYNILGNLISSTSYSSVTALTITSEYDSNENETQKTILDRNSGETILYEYEYDSNGHLIKTAQTTDVLTIVIQEAEYDNNGNKFEEKTYDYDGNIMTWSEYSMGKETKYISYKSDGSISSQLEREYDNGGNKIKEIISFNNDGSIITYENEYKYNDNGYLVVFSQNSHGLVYTTEYEYDEDGNKIKETGPGYCTEYIFE